MRVAVATEVPSKGRTISSDVELVWNSRGSEMRTSTEKESFR